MPGRTKRQSSPHIHNHAHCVEHALNTAEAICKKRNLRLTPIRKRVLELVWSSHKPRGAYAILDLLGKGTKKQAPLTVYRALDFLVAHGLVHRLESLNAYIGCTDPTHDHQGTFLVCTKCQDVSEVNDKRLTQSLDSIAQSQNFKAQKRVVEIAGLCQECRGA